MSPLVDIHTHQHGLQAGCTGVVSLDITELFRSYGGDVDMVCKAVEDSGDYVSVGIHPWNAGDASEACFSLLQTVTERCPNVLLLGEAGLDKLRPVGLSLQENIFHLQVTLSEVCRKPMVIHCVRAVDELLRIRKTVCPRQRWIIHGFRGKAEQAGQLLRAGLDISLGERFNPSALRAIPLERLWLETDMAKTTISSVYSAVIQALGFSAEVLAEDVFRRFTQLTENNNSSLHHDSSL